MDATAAADWERLRANGLAWVTAYDAARSATVASLEGGATREPSSPSASP
ncbi:hypothetical protein ACR6C2_34580 [Streptomyces sp. INA 01156]